MNYKFVELSYMNFGNGARWYDKWTKEFLKEILPEQMYEYLSSHCNNYDYFLFDLVQSLVKLCGYSENEIIHFEHFESDYIGLRTRHTIFAKNDLYTMHITTTTRFNAVEIEFYNNKTNNLFCTLSTSLISDSSSSDFIHRYKDVVIDCFERDANNETYNIGKCSRGTYGYNVIISGTVYFVPYRHVDHLEDGEDWETIYDAQKEYFDIF